jgi:general secretion pathway protein K
MASMPPSSHKQRGVAILTALLVVAVGTIIAVDLVWQSTLDQRRTAAALAADQSLMFALGAEAWVADVLRQDLVDSPDSDHLGELWATDTVPLPFEGGVIAGRVEDLQGRFNLNNLIGEDGEEDELARQQFERLLALLELDSALAGNVIDWLDSNVEQHFPTGAEDSTYTDQDPPYRTANTLITSPSELMAIAGFDLERYRRIAPYVTALPRGTTLNVNTASDMLIASLSDDIDLSLAASLIDERGDAEFPDVETVFADLIAPEMFARIGGVSEHFLLTGTVVMGSNQMTLRSVLQRDNSGLTRALFRSFGVE